MAVGDRKIKIVKISILEGEPVKAIAEWKMVVESKVTGDLFVKDGAVSFVLAATRADLKALTGQDIDDAATAAITAQAGKAVPASDSVAIS